MTKKEQRAIIDALATWEPQCFSVGLGPNDRRELRYQAAIVVGTTFGIEQEQIEVWVDSTRMYEGARKEVNG